MNSTDFCPDPGPRPKRRVAILLELDQPYPWHHVCLRGILHGAEVHGWDCVIDPHLVGEAGRVDLSACDGVVGRIGHRVADAARERGIPAVNHWLNSPAKGLPGVFHDYEPGTRLATDHFLQRGFRRFGCVGYTRDKLDRADAEFLTRLLAEHGLEPPQTHHVRRVFEQEPKTFIQFKNRLKAWLDALDKPVGLIVSSSVIGRYLAQFCRELGLRVPHDIAVIVQTGDHTIDTSANPTLSSIDHDYFQVGYQAARLLGRMMDGEHIGPGTRVLVPPRRLLVRESSDTFISANPLVSEALRYIADHAGQSLTVTDVADAVSTSRRTLERAFDEHLDQSVYSEITRFRAEYIKRSLIDSDEPLASVAVDCGFVSVSHFTEFFRKAVGLTPSRYRRQSRRVGR